MNKTLLFLLLILSLNGIAKDYKGAEIRTKESFLYGRFEVKMKSCEASGMLISFFTFYDDPSFVNNWNEIDIEILGRYSNEVQFNAIVGKHEMHEKRQVLNFNPHKDFHTYSFEWTPEYIAWSVDGIEAYKLTGAHVAKMDKAQKIMMNIWPSQFWEWTGPWDESKLPLTALYDHVKYYEYVADKPEKFILKWEDQFDKLDYSRWEFATHTFDGNNCDFDPSNGFVKGGFLSLELTKSLAVSPSENEYKSEPKNATLTINSATSISKGKRIKVLFKSPVTKADVRKENFKIEGVNIEKSILWMDGTTVELILGDPVSASENTILKYTAPNQPTQEIPLGK